MSGKTVHDYTDEELAALSTEELSALRGDNHDGETDEERAAREAAEAAAAGNANAPAPAPASAGNEDLDPDALAALAAEGEGNDGSRMVPHARFEEVNKERKLLLEEVIRLRGTTAAPAPAPAPAPPPYDFKAKRKEYHALLLEDPEKAAVLLEEIEDARDQQIAQQLKEAEERGVQRATENFSRQRTQDNAASTAARIYETYPFLNHESKDADATAIFAVIGQRDALIAQGVDPVEAMRRASEEVGAKFAKLLGAPGAAPAPAPAASGTPHPRQVDATRKAADAAGRQPPTPQGGIGNRVADDGKLDINNLTDEQLLKLTPDELAKLRGDNRIPA